MRMAVNVRVEDYETWREGFDGDKENRDKHGIRNTQVYQNTDDENDVTVVGEVDDVGKVAAALRSPEYRQRMKDHGVQGEPKIFNAEPA